MKPVEIRRDGNLLSTPFQSELDQLFSHSLRYTHRTYFQGYELVERKRLKRMSPSSIGRPEFEDTPCRLYQQVGEHLVCAAGMKHRVLTLLTQLGVEHSYVDTRKRTLPPADYNRLASIPDLSFRHRQDEVLAIIDSCDGGVIKAPTGYGKTFLAVLISMIYPRSRIAFISPGLDLMKSTYSRLCAAIPGDIGRIGGGHCDDDRRVMLCSADSIHKVPLGKVQLVIYDEVHTAATSKRSEMLCQQHTDAKFVGFTASPNLRFDGADALVEAIFGPLLIAIDYSEAADAGMVAPIHTQFVEVPRSARSPSVSGEAWLKKRTAYWCNGERNEKIASICAQIPTWLNNEDPQILIMVETVEHLFNLRHYLPEFTPVYADMSDKIRERLLAQGDITEDEQMTPERRGMLLKQFETGKLRRVIANYCWKQGIDPVHLNVLIRADGGTSPINSIQLPGRLSRVTADKKEGLLIDLWDSFDQWALRRSQVRSRAYKENGFNLLPRM